MGVVTSLFVTKMVAAAGDAVDGAALLRTVGIDPAGAVDPAAMVADHAYYDLLERIAGQTDATELPLRTGASMRCDDYGALGLAFKTAPTLGGSYGRVARYARLWTSVVDYTLEPAAEGVWFHLHRAGARRLGLRLSNEATLASAISIAREVATGPVVPLAVHARHDAPARIDAHRRYFGCDVTFGSDRDAILFASETLDRPNRLGDEGLTAYLTGLLDAAIGDLPGRATLREEVRDWVTRDLSEGAPRMEDIARRMGLSVRSLHRRLAAEGLSFQDVLAETRRDVAAGLLREGRYGLAEIAFLTGFAEQSAFTRAFKRWTGRTPAAYRREAGGG
ncbi:AraC family transcriptional regulator [Ovoidimarina sediminis]|uniref:AraC family transcriptional regulator n=1 Tax=Ovoidimarina sediminis TaxID=3079856 RepID=UPI00290E3E8C|nr:AraC family transcriptional regulator [Rhodophyticola sp. MJ-SS7]MDU8946212.1 AraC family transcriptional regulator [Rhodophyticola sp. MJ-SS7]